MNEAIAACLSTVKADATEPDSPIVKSAGSYELKFLLADAAADELLKRARMHLAPDPHADPALGDRYRVNSLYFDTVDLAVHRRLPSYGRRKYRLRRYGAESNVFLERKAKSNELVRKRRTTIPERELAMLERAATEPSTWPGTWFQRRLIMRRLAPTCQVAYERVARVGMTPEGSIRLTVDRSIRCCPAAGFNFPCLVDGATLLPGQSVVEFKFRVTLPALFKSWMHELALTPTSASKYRMSVEAAGLQAGVSDIGRAESASNGAEVGEATKPPRYA